jgi:hypothetical protein
MRLTTHLARILLRNLYGRENLGDLCVGGWLKLKWILEKLNYQCRLHSPGLWQGIVTGCCEHTSSNEHLHYINLGSFVTSATYVTFWNQILLLAISQLLTDYRLTILYSDTLGESKSLDLGFDRCCKRERVIEELKLSLRVMRFHNMKTNWGLDGQLHAFLNGSAEGNEWLVSIPGGFTPGENPCTHRMCPRAGLVAAGKINCCQWRLWISVPAYSVRNLVTVPN